MEKDSEEGIRAFIEKRKPILKGYAMFDCKVDFQ